MLHLCHECPVECFASNNIDVDNDNLYKHWVSTERTTLVTHHSPVEELISKTVDDVYELCHHHFISKAQAAHLRSAKENLSQNEVYNCPT